MTNAFVNAARKVYHPLHFDKGYNFTLYFIFAGALLGFVLARLQFIDIDGVFCNPKATAGGAAPGECYWYSMSLYRIGITLHLGCILPAAFLAIFQFTPVIRHKVTLYHRMAGYVIVTLVLVANAGAFIIAPHSFGGALTTQAGVGLLAILSTVGVFLAIYNIKRMQIDQHRKWMLRTWFYMGSIITLRLIMIITALIISEIPGAAYQTTPCPEIVSIYGSADAAYHFYPACEPANAALNPRNIVVVAANFNGNPVEIGAALGVAFPMAMWLAIFMHVVGVELYIMLTPREHERLRQVSWERQMARGYRNPGSAGLVLEMVGDMDPWTPEPRVATLAESVAVGAGSRRAASIEADKPSAANKRVDMHLLLRDITLF
ncbi:hypothetical protein FIBSPDRAFT_918616 [Athelia psychrophila]|uniref:DUF2306 domain-containing protein n=1 Tax=Athelia psychrophila TaxID=1759441 RepID=A0A166NJI9_9AGAM|nr:hypothetical protein FIBSPDRAFT_918616 [Fibularhizoctonia sp. CBS 109695]